MIRTCRNQELSQNIRNPCDCWYAKLFTEPLSWVDAFWWSRRPKSTWHLKNLDFFQFRATIVMIRTCHNQELTENIRQPCDCWYTKLFTASFHFFRRIRSECVPKCSRSKSAPGPIYGHPKVIWCAGIGVIVSLCPLSSGLVLMLNTLPP